MSNTDAPTGGQLLRILCIIALVASFPTLYVAYVCGIQVDFKFYALGFLSSLSGTFLACTGEFPVVAILQAIASLVSALPRTPRKLK